MARAPGGKKNLCYAKLGGGGWNRIDPKNHSHRTLDYNSL